MKSAAPARARLSRQGQGSLLAIMVLTTLLGAFVWISGNSIESRRKEELRSARRLHLRVIESRLQQALRSPSYVNDVLVPSSRSVQDFMKAIRATPPNRNIVTGYPGTPPKFESVPLPGGGVWFGKGARHDRWDFSACTKAGFDTEECPYESRIEMAVVEAGGVGYIQIVVRFEPRKGLKVADFNSDHAENRIVASFPVNLHGVRLSNRTIACEPGHKALLVGQDPMEFLCAGE